MPDLDLLGTFLEIYRLGSITSAAASLGVSQPSVSERLARLEAQLGAALFDRSSRGVTPTATADRLAARIADPIDRLRQATADPDAPLTGTVRIGGASDVIASRVIPALAPLTLSGISFEFTLGLAQPLIDALAHGRLDLVIASIRPAHPGGSLPRARRRGVRAGRRAQPRRRDRPGAAAQRSCRSAPPASAGRLRQRALHRAPLLAQPVRQPAGERGEHRRARPARHPRGRRRRGRHLGTPPLPGRPRTRRGTARDPASTRSSPRSTRSTWRCRRAFRRRPRRTPSSPDCSRRPGSGTRSSAAAARGAELRG